MTSQSWTTGCYRYVNSTVWRTSPLKHQDVTAWATSLTSQMQLCDVTVRYARRSHHRLQQRSQTSYTRQHGVPSCPGGQPNDARFCSVASAVPAPENLRWCGVAKEGTDIAKMLKQSSTERVSLCMDPTPIQGSWIGHWPRGGSQMSPPHHRLPFPLCHRHCHSSLLVCCVSLCRYIIEYSDCRVPRGTSIRHSSADAKNNTAKYFIIIVSHISWRH